MAGNDAAFAFKTGFSARALIGLLGNDDFSFKVSPDGSAFFDAIRIDHTSGRIELPEPVVMPALAAAPDPPPAGKLAVYAVIVLGPGGSMCSAPRADSFRCNRRIRNLILPLRNDGAPEEGGRTIYNAPSGQTDNVPIYDAAMAYQSEGALIPMASRLTGWVAAHQARQRS